MTKKASSFFEDGEVVFINKTLRINSLKEAEKIGVFCFNQKRCADEYEKYGSGLYHIICQRYKTFGETTDIFKINFIGEYVETADEFLTNMRFLRTELLYVSKPYEIWESIKKNPHKVRLSFAEAKRLEELDEGEVMAYKQLLTDYAAGAKVDIPSRKVRRTELNRINDYNVDFAQMQEDGFVFDFMKDEKDE